MKVIVIGGGLFGCCSAIELARAGFEVQLVERENDLMQKASRVNHNRIHLGYHYLRSVETAEQSIEGLLSFLFNYGKAVENQFPNYYAIAKEGSKTTPDEFLAFCNKVGIGYDFEYPSDDFLNRDTLAASFKVPEPVFDYEILKNEVGKGLVSAGVELRLSQEVQGITKNSGGGYELIINQRKEYFDVVINATYSDFNEINHALGVPLKPLLFEKVLIPEFEFKHNPFGLTIMDGPFCSVMPKGKQTNKFLLYHVTHSVEQGVLSELHPTFNADNPLQEDLIYQQATRFMPFLASVKHTSLFKTVRVVHKNSDDARLTELYVYEQFENYFAILSGKISTCIQVALEIKHTLQHKKTEKRFRI
ncbi:MAG: FAD-dependent oxidoreductase [Flavobacteriales bacterium]